MISAQRSAELQIGEAGETLLRKYARRAAGNWAGLLGRLVILNAICGVCLLLAVLLLHLFHSLPGWSLYLTNLTAIGIVMLWDFGMNARFNWRSRV